MAKRKRKFDVISYKRRELKNGKEKQKVWRWGGLPIADRGSSETKQTCRRLHNSPHPDMLQHVHKQTKKSTNKQTTKHTNKQSKQQTPQLQALQLTTPWHFTTCSQTTNKQQTNKSKNTITAEGSTAHYNLTCYIMFRNNKQANLPYAIRYTTHHTLLLLLLLLLLLQLITRKDQPLANDHPKGLCSCKKCIPIKCCKKSIFDDILQEGVATDFFLIMIHSNWATAIRAHLRG